MQKEVTKLLEEHKELIMESFNPIGGVFDEMNAQFNLMINEVEKLIHHKMDGYVQRFEQIRENVDKGYTKQHVQKWVDWSKNKS